VLVAQLDFADPEFPVSLVEKPAPTLPGPAWARVQVTGGGICGSDLHAIYPGDTGSSTLTPFVAFPFEMGHEIGGVVVEAGADCPVPVGSRVAVDPTIACAARGLDLCVQCLQGNYSTCLRIGDGVLTRGMSHGFTTDLGSGWAEELVAHVSQLHVAPDSVPTIALALAEPLSIVLHGFLRRPPVDGVPVLVVGAGIIGLAAVAALRAFNPSSEITVVTRHEHQAQTALAIGAHHVVTDGPDAIESLASISGGRVTGRKRGQMISDGYRVTVEAAGSASAFDLACKAASQRGVVHCMGSLNRVAVDLAPAWFKELDLVGTFAHSVDTDPTGARVHSFDRALAILAAGGYPADRIVTHRFPLTSLREAIETALARDRGAIKVQLQPPTT
jgi:threonine dehydrogenase-like Zn-dependent dehydrogenase